MEYSFLSETHQAVEIYNSYIKVAKELNKKLLPFERILDVYGLAASSFIKHIPLLKRMDNENPFESFYNQFKKEIEKEDRGHLIKVPFESWLKSCKEKDIVSNEEFDILSDLLEKLVNKKLDAVELEGFLDQVEAFEEFDILVKEA
jgi:hypothetical protein